MVNDCNCFSNGKIISHKLLAFWLSWILFTFQLLLKILKSLGNFIWFVFGLGCAKDGAYYYESFDFSVTTSVTKCSTPLLKISLFTFYTGYGCENIGLELFFNCKYTGSVFLVLFSHWTTPRFFNKWSKYLCCYLV